MLHFSFEINSSQQDENTAHNNFAADNMRNTFSRWSCVESNHFVMWLSLMYINSLVAGSFFIPNSFTKSSRSRLVKIAPST